MKDDRLSGFVQHSRSLPATSRPCIDIRDAATLAVLISDQVPLSVVQVLDSPNCSSQTDVSQVSSGSCCWRTRAATSWRASRASAPGQ